MRGTVGMTITRYRSLPAQNAPQAISRREQIDESAARSDPRQDRSSTRDRFPLRVDPFAVHGVASAGNSAPGSPRRLVESGTASGTITAPRRDRRCIVRVERLRDFDVRSSRF